MPKINPGDTCYAVDRITLCAEPGDEGLVIGARGTELQVVWSKNGRTTWTRREHLSKVRPAKRGDLKEGDTVVLKSNHYTVGRIKQNRRKQRLPKKHSRGTVLKFNAGNTAAYVAWEDFANDSETEGTWVDLTCLTTRPSQDELKGVYKSLGVSWSSEEG